MSERGPDPRQTLHDRDGALGVAGAGALGGIVKPAAEASPGAEKLPRPFGKYMLMRKLAAGGMAELFLALHRAVAGFEKLVVIKRILPQMNQDQEFIDRMQADLGEMLAESREICEAVQRQVENSF